MEHRTCSSTMLLVISYGIDPICIQYMNVNYEYEYVLVFLIMDPLQKLVLAPGATSQNNMVFKNIF